MSVILSDLEKEMIPWIDEETKLVQAADHGRDNLILHTAHLMQLLLENNHLDRYIYWSGVVFGFLSNPTVRTSPGFYRRYPNGPMDNSVDNYIGAACANDYHCMWIRAQGHMSNWCFNVEEPYKFKLKYWFGRFIGFPPFIKMASGEPVGLLSQLFFSVACIYSSLSSYGNTSDKLLQLLMNKRVKGKHFLVDKSISVWRWIMNKKYKRGEQELYGIYYGKAHPFAEYSKERF